MAVLGRLLMMALLVAVVVAPATVTAARLLQRLGDDRSGSDTEDRDYGRQDGDLRASFPSAKHRQQSPYNDRHKGNNDGDDSTDNGRWGTQQSPSSFSGSHPQKQDDVDSSSRPQTDNNGDDNPAQPSWPSTKNQGASEQPSTPASSAPQSASKPASGKTSSGRRRNGSNSGSNSTPPAGSDSSSSTPTGTGTTPPAPGNSDSATNGSSGTLSDRELQKALDVHNSLRAKHGAGPLVWNTQLATQAQNWAKGCSHPHSIKDDNWIYGESIQWGVPNFEAAIMEWYSEVSKYHGQANCYSDETAHFSQIVWKATKNLGCGYSSCSDKMKFYVCQYTPGNGEQGSCQQNVQA